MNEHHFETHQPVELYVEIGKGSVEVTAADTTESHVEVSGPEADDVRVTLDGDRLSVIAPQQRSGWRSGDARLEVVVTVPTGSDLVTRLGSADLVTHGRLGAAQLRSGSGDVRLDALAGPAQVESGSGDLHVEVVEQALRVKSGSGDVEIVHAGGDSTVSTGSGDVALGRVDGAAVVKSGSGDLRVGAAGGDVAFTTGSGDALVDTVLRGRVTIKGASGDVRVGVPAGVPVWTDISTVSGQIGSDLESAGQPEPGADHVELRIKTVSGDVVLTQV